ncbi:MAG: UDP-N-acetylglucosamine pyrophosphorylase [Chlorobium sp.]|nr:MAG: UDP-N-acetylglucosamine pyrophosphorylase [Chlorobium sp.]
MALAVIILAAGKGTRMQSELPKVLHLANGLPLIDYVLETAQSLQPEKIVLVVGHQAERVINASARFKVAAALQEPQLGTGHAVMQTETHLHDFQGEVLILSGDAPLVNPLTLKNLIAFHRSTEAVATVLTAELDDPTGYGRIIRKTNSDTVLKIVEQKDASEGEREVKEINSGVYVFNAKVLFDALGQIDTNNAQKEYYLTDVFAVCFGKGTRVCAFTTDNADEILGINTPSQLHDAEMWLHQNPELFS